MAVEARNIVGTTERMAISHEITKSAMTSRKFQEYCETFDYSKESLKGKAILDVGSGFSDFVQEARAIGAKAVKLDGIYPMRNILFPEQKKDAVAGFVQYLPFKDNFFDETISLYCLYHVKTGLDQAIGEMIRVTKPDGKIRIYPVYDVGFTYRLKNESNVSLVEVKEAKTLVISKTPNYTADRWQTLANKITSAVVFSERY